MLLPLTVLLVALGAAAGQTPPPPLRVALYYEALCPDSRRFVVEQLAPTWGSVGAAVLALEYVPWGKAQVNASDGEPEITCQHGADECWGNRVHACVIKRTRSADVRLQAVACLMKDYEQLRTTAPACARAAGLVWEEVSACAESAASLKEELEFGARTGALQPPLEFVPTVTVDGSQSGQKAMLADFLFYVCTAWQQRTGEAPAGCDDL